MFRRVLLIGIVSCLAACSRHHSGVVIIQEEGRNIISTSSDNVVDVPQNLGIFRSQIRVKSIQKRQQKLNKEFDQAYFSPWKDNIKIAIPSKFSGSFYCENLHKISKSEFLSIKNNIACAKTVNLNGIIIRSTMAKRWPTESQFFESLKRPGDSYPFDSNIQSLIRFGVPVKITAISQDGLWAFVNSYAFSGWVSMNDVAYVDKDFIKQFQSNKMAVAIYDKIAITHKSAFVSRADIGTVLPQKGRNVLCPHKKSNGYAELVPCSSSGFVPKPLQFTASNVMHIAKQFLGQKYGWGGYLNLRDCSMLTMDFFTTFGILIARNGNSQLTQGQFTKLTGNKSAFIKKHAIPFLTVVGKKGHVMLYVGQYNGQPVFLHNIWGVPMKPGLKTRYVIGKTVLTSTKFGAGVIPNETRSLGEIIELMRVL